MPSITAMKGTVVALALGLLSNTARASTESPEPAPPTVEITTQELDASNAKVEAVYNALIQMWSADFKQIG